MCHELGWHGAAALPEGVEKTLSLGAGTAGARSWRTWRRGCDTPWQGPPRGRTLQQARSSRPEVRAPPAPLLMVFPIWAAISVNRTLLLSLMVGVLLSSAALYSVTRLLLLLADAKEPVVVRASGFLGIASKRRAWPHTCATVLSQSALRKLATWRASA